MNSDMDLGVPQWKGYLLQLQNEAPKPLLVACRKYVEKPPYYGEECHGLISREEGEMLCSREGNYLIRESQNDRGRFTLVLRVLGAVKNFKLYYENGKHFVGEKKFDDIYSLAEDGMITMFVEGKAQSYIEQMNRDPVYSSLSRYSYNRRNNRKELMHNDYLLGYNADCEETQSYYDDEMRMATYQPAVRHNNAVATQQWNHMDGHVMNGSSPHLKKNLTPTSSDERRNRNKKKQRSLDEMQMRRESNGSTSESSITSSELRHSIMTSSPRRTPVPQDKCTLDANENFVTFKTRTSRSPAPTNGQIVTQRESDFFKCCSNDQNANSFHQLRQFIEETEANNTGAPLANKAVQRSKTSVSNRPISARQHTVSNNAHYRQRSEPVELLNMNSVYNRSERRTPPLSEHDEIFHSRGGAARTKKSNAYCGSGGSCDSSLSNVSNLSTGSSALPPQNDIINKPPLDAVSHVSSEEGIGDDRVSTPSPESTNQRRYTVQHDNFYPNDMMNRSYHGNDPRLHNSTSDTRLLHYHAQENHFINDSKFSRSEPSFPGLKRSPTYHGREIHKHEDRKERHKSTGETLPEYDEETINFCQLTNKTHAHPTVTRRESFKQAQSKSQVSRSKSTPSPRKPKLRENASSPVNQITINKSKNSPRDYDKEHSFKRQTYHGLQWCEYCGNFMWGIVQQGMQCKDCGLNVHKQCAKMVPGNCQPALKHIKHVFGIDLTTLVKLHGTERPIVVDKCIYELENRGLSSEGLYRVNGFHDQVQEIKQEFNRHGGGMDLSNYDVNTIACAFKMYLRELPVPLLPYTLYSRFINASKLTETNEKLDAINTALRQMPAAHMNTLIFIISHLGRICEYPGNQMDPHNLGIVFGPTMLRAPEKEAGYGLNDATYQQEIIETMIEYRKELFGTVLNTTV